MCFDLSTPLPYAESFTGSEVLTSTLVVLLTFLPHAPLRVSCPRDSVAVLVNWTVPCPLLIQAQVRVSVSSRILGPSSYRVQCAVSS